MRGREGTRAGGKPGATEIEMQLIGWLASQIGLPAGAGGTMTSGGAIANLTAHMVSLAPQLTHGFVGARPGHLFRQFLAEVVAREEPR